MQMFFVSIYRSLNTYINNTCSCLLSHLPTAQSKLSDEMIRSAAAIIIDILKFNMIICASIIIVDCYCASISFWISLRIREQLESNEICTYY